VSSNDPFREKAEAYALGALDPAERAEFEAHLAGRCADCEKAVAEARWLVAQLAYVAPDSSPSEAVKRRLMQTVRAEAGTAQFPSRSGGPGRIPWWMWAAVAALVLVTAYSSWNARQLEKQVAETNRRADQILREHEQLVQQRDTLQREAAILMSPASAKIMLMPEHKDMPTLEARWHPQLGLCVTGHQVPMPAKNHVLQLWLIPKDPAKKPMPSITFWPEQNGKLAEVEMHPPETMNDVKAIAVTEEPMGGSPQPTSTPMWVGAVS
jgi:anti-sigma-K factor RskA